MKKVLVFVLLAVTLFGCGKTEKNPAKLERTFECSNGVLIEFKKDGTVVFSSNAISPETGTYTKDSETAYRVTFDDGSGGYVKVDGDDGGIVANPSTSAKEVDAIAVTEVDIPCKAKK